MSRTLRPATLDDRERVVAHLHRVFPHFSPDTWRLLFDYGCDDPPDYGMLTEDASGEILAFIGALYSDRRIGGRQRRIVNMSSYSVREDQRGKGIGSELALAYVERMHAAGYPLTILSSGAGGMAFWQNNGFEPVCCFREVRFPRPPVISAATRRLPSWVDPADVQVDDVGPEPHRIMVDHQTLNCRVGALRVGSRTCVVITRPRTVMIRRPPWMKSLALGPSGDRSGLVRLWSHIADVLAGVIVTSEVVYASDHAFVQDHMNGVAFRICARDRTLALSGADGLLGLAPPSGPAEMNDYMAVLEGADRSELDITYSELLVLPFGQ